MARIPWIFTDPVGAVSYEFPINPREGGSPSYTKNISTKTTTAPGPNAAVLLFEGADNPPAFEASGTLLTEQQYYDLKEWYEKRVLLTLEDDLGRVFVIYLQALDFKRVPKRSSPWRHTFSFSAVIVG